MYYFDRSAPHYTRPSVHPAKPLLYSLPRAGPCAQAAPQDCPQSTSSILGPAPDEASPPMSGMPPPGIPPMPSGMPPPPPPCWYILLMMGLQVPSSSLSLCSSSSTCTGAKGRQEQAGQWDSALLSYLGLISAGSGAARSCSHSWLVHAFSRGPKQACHSCMPERSPSSVQVLTHNVQSC